MTLIFTLSPAPSDHGTAPSAITKALGVEHGLRTVALQFPPLDLSERTHLWVLQAFNRLADSIEQEEAAHLRRAIAVVDVVMIKDLIELDPLSTIGNPHAAVVALLILAFPEIHWMFVGPHERQADFIGAHLLDRDARTERVVRLGEQGCIPLFDPTGLRERVRARVREAAEMGAQVASYVPARTAVAVAIDEEQDYAFLNAYVIYRFGYRCHTLTSYENAVRVLRSDVQILFEKAGEYNEIEGSITLGHYIKALVSMHEERVSCMCPSQNVVSFLNTPEFKALSSQESYTSRSEAEKLLLEKAEKYASQQKRVRVGLRDVAAVLLEQFGFKIQDENWDTALDSKIVLSLEDLYLNFPDKDPELNAHLSMQDVRNKVFGKLQEVPHRIFVTTGHERGTARLSFFFKIKKYLRAREHDETPPARVYKPWSGIFDIWNQVNTQGPADWFVWPPEASTDSDQVNVGHSAHGRLLLVAERLIARAQRIIGEARAVPDFIQGAVLAIEAKEYLGHRTPTTSLEALALQHQFEVLAECQFYGVEHNMNVPNRLKDIERELAAIGEWFRPAKRSRSCLNAEIRIVNELLLIFREHSQFDEEQQALVKLRALHRGIWLRRRPWAWLLWPMRAYIELLLSSVSWLVGGFAFWIAILSLFYVVSGHGGDPYWVDRYWHGFVDTMISFVGLSPPHGFDEMWNSPGALRVCMVAFSMGFLHLGIFITHLYAILARR